MTSSDASNICVMLLSSLGGGRRYWMGEVYSAGILVKDQVYLSCLVLLI
jgi:hypothetical protein